VEAVSDLGKRAEAVVLETWLRNMNPGGIDETEANGLQIECENEIRETSNMVQPLILERETKRKTITKNGDYFQREAEQKFDKEENKALVSPKPY